jgi:hypothetical protein
VDQHWWQQDCWWYFLHKTGVRKWGTPIFWLFDSHTEVPGADLLLFLHDTAQANLTHMGDCVDWEEAMSQWDKEIETEAAWQAHYIQWGLIMSILDPCGHQKGYQRIVAIYIKYLMSGVNFRNKDFLRLATVQGYMSSINLLFRLWSMEARINTSDPNNMAGILINNLVKEEDIARQRSPLDSNIFTKLLWKLIVSHLPDSEQRTLFNLIALGCYIGPRVSKYAQTM